MKSWVVGSQFYDDVMSITAKDEYVHALGGDATAHLPTPLKDWLARLRLLYGVPFAYLVPNEKLLPKEGVRFFYIDRNWTDRLVDGALSVGKTTTKEYAHHHAVHKMLIRELDTYERSIRVILRGLAEEEPGSGEGIDLTGMLLRSRVVSGWPGLEVKAYTGEPDENGELDDDDRLLLIRMERLAADILLCIFHGIPDIVDIEEPREGIQFGVDMGGGDQIGNYTLDHRYTDGDDIGWTVGHPMIDPNGEVPEEDKEIKVPVRKTQRDVIHIKSLATSLPDRLVAVGAADQADHLKDPEVKNENGHPRQDLISPAHLAVQMLQFPYHQRFMGEGEPPPGQPQAPLLRLKSTYTHATLSVKRDIDPLSEAEINLLLGR